MRDDLVPVSKKKADDQNPLSGLSVFFLLPVTFHDVILKPVESLIFTHRPVC
jgi:hypothetical protein